MGVEPTKSQNMTVSWRRSALGAFGGDALSDARFAWKMQPPDYANTQALGKVLYTDYVYPFELASVLLLAAIVAAIALAFRGRRNRRAQTIAKQLSVHPKQRLRLVDLRAEKK